MFRPSACCWPTKPHAGFNNLATSCSYFLESTVDELYEFSFFHAFFYNPLTRLIIQVFYFSKIHLVCLSVICRLLLVACCQVSSRTMSRLLTPCLFSSTHHYLSLLIAFNTSFLSRFPLFCHLWM